MTTKKANMIYDQFLLYLYSLSPLSQATKTIYMRIVTRCCQYWQVTHCLDTSPDQLDTYRVYLLNERHYSPSSDTIVYNAFRHTYTVLLPQIDKALAEPYLPYFQQQPRQPYTLPQNIDKDIMQCFLEALPRTIAGYLIKEIYRGSKSFDEVVKGWKCNKNHAQHVCASTARQVGIPHGFGLTGVRTASILHRIQARQNDTELKTIIEESGLSAAQFARYLKASKKLHEHDTQRG